MNIDAMIDNLVRNHIEAINSWGPLYKKEYWSEHADKNVRCEECQRYGRNHDMIMLWDEVAPSVRGSYHHKCARIALIRYQRECAVCGQQFTAPYPNGEYSQVCKNCLKDKRIKSEVQRVWYESKRTTISTLTIKEWLTTLDYFGWSCAYCGHSPFYALEHFIPVARGGGTARGNCVPACRHCNSRKRDKNPFDTDLPNVQLVADYLSRFR